MTNTTKYYFESRDIYTREIYPQGCWSIRRRSNEAAWEESVVPEEKDLGEFHRNAKALKIKSVFSPPIVSSKIPKYHSLLYDHCSPPAKVVPSPAWIIAGHNENNPEIVFGEKKLTA